MGSSIFKSILTLKALLISGGVASIAAALKLSAPLLLRVSGDHLPLLTSLLKPPYLYVLVNAIIISIAASSRLYHQPLDLDVTAPEISVMEPIPVTYREVVEEEISVAGEKLSTVELSSERFSEVVDGESAWTPMMKSSEIVVLERPLVSSRFGHRKPVKGGTEAEKALKVVKLKRHETLEQTWKAITEGRAMPLTRHLKKSDTFENHDCHIDISMWDPPHPVTKSETFKDRSNPNQPPPPFMSGSTRLKKEPSLGRDELNKRVEAFISKFNEEMRLQRQESLNQFKEMINRGSY